MRETCHFPRSLFFFFCLISFCFLFSCQKEEIMKTGLSREAAGFTAFQAREAFFSGHPGIRMPRLLLPGPAVKTADVPGISFSVRWNEFIYREDAVSVIYEFELSGSDNLAACFLSGPDGHKRIIPGQKIARRLVIRKFKEKDTVQAFVASVIGLARDGVPASGISPYQYTGSRKNFNGYMVISSPEGEVCSAWYYGANRREKVCLTAYEAGRDGKYERGFAILRQSVLTKGFDFDPEKFCHYCGEYIGDLACVNCSGLDDVWVVEDGNRCPECFEYKRNCLCHLDRLCVDCGWNPCQCRPDFCRYCHDRFCNGECREYHEQGNPDKFVEITLLTNGNGSLSGDGTYAVGSPATVTAICSAGSVFGGWTENRLVVSMSTRHSFEVTGSRCLTGYFHLKDSDCGKLAMKYKGNTLLKSTFVQLNEKKRGNNKEHAFLLSDSGESDYFEGSKGCVNFDFNKYASYSFVVHNHELSPIPSPEDVIAIYKAYKAGRMREGGGIIMQMEKGTMCLEIENGTLFEEFIWEYFGEIDAYIAISKETLFAYYQFFQNEILGNPPNAELKNKEVIDKAIKFYTSGRGLKVVYNSGDGLNYNWSYVRLNNNELFFENCIK